MPDRSFPRRRIVLLALALAAVAAGIAAGPLWRFVRPMVSKDVINRHAPRYGFDPVFVMALVKAESKFRKDARSHRGAVGLMQIMPDTAREMAQRIGIAKPLSNGDLEDPDLNVRLGLHYLALLREEFKGDPVSMLAAYNAGPANVRAWREKGALTIDAIPFGQTRRFVAKVLTSYEWLKRLQAVRNVLHV